MSHSPAVDILSLFTPQQGLTVLVTVGNTLRSDDGLGPYIAAGLKDTPLLRIVNAESNPENIVEEVIALRPERVIFIDAADFGGHAGEARLIDKEHIPETALSTHMISLKVIARIVSEDTRAPVFFLGIQPKHVGRGEGLSPEVTKTAEAIIEMINKNF